MAKLDNRTGNNTGPGPLVAIGLILAAGLLFILTLAIAVVIVIPTILFVAIALSAVRWLQSRKSRAPEPLVVIEGEYEILDVARDNGRQRHDSRDKADGAPPR